MLLRALSLAFAVLAGALCACAQEEFKRDLEEVSFVPKGAWVSGVNVSYNQADQNNYAFLVLENINANNYSFKVSPTVMYAFADNLTTGARFSYNRQCTKLRSTDVVISSDMNLNVDNLYSLSHNYCGALLFRNYMSLGASTRFGLFNEVQLQLGGGQAKMISGVGESLTGTYEENFVCSVGLAPGMSVFLNNYSALEVNVGVLGFEYNYTRSITDQIYVAHRRTQYANFKVNLFSITFGVMFYI